MSINRHLLAPFGFCGKRGIDFVATSCLLVFPFARRGAPCKIFTAQGVDKSTTFVFIPLRPTNKFACRSVTKQKDVEILRHLLASFWFCGKRGIRTPGPVKINGFQDRRIRPLCHLSATKVQPFFDFAKYFLHHLQKKFVVFSFSPTFYAFRGVSFAWFEGE